MKDISIALTQMFSPNRENQRYKWMVSSLSSVPWMQLSELMLHSHIQQEIRKQIALLCVKIMANYGDILGVSLFETLYGTFEMEDRMSNSVIKSILLQGFLTSEFAAFMSFKVCSYLQNPAIQSVTTALNSLSSVDEAVAKVLFSSVWEEILSLADSAIHQCQIQKGPSEILNACLRSTVKYLPFASYSAQLEGVLMEGVSILPLCTTREQLGILQMLEMTPECVLKELSTMVLNHVIMCFVFVVSRESRVALKGLLAFTTWIPFFPLTQLEMFVKSMELNQNALLLLPTNSILSLLFVVLQRLDSLKVPEAPENLSKLLVETLQDSSENIVMFVHGYRRLALTLPLHQELCTLIRNEIGNSDCRLSFLDIIAAKEVRLIEFHDP